MAYGFSDFDLRAISTPKLLIPGDLSRPYPQAYSSALGLAVDNLVKWVAVVKGKSRLSFDAIGHELRGRSVEYRLLYPRHMRRGGWWRDRLGVPTPRYDTDGPPEPSLPAEEIDRRRERWDEAWRRTIAQEIVRPILQGKANTIDGGALARYLVEFVWAPQLREDAVLLAAAARELHELLQQISVPSLASSCVVVDANFGFEAGNHFILSALEPDLLLDDVLIDVKLTMPQKVSRRLFEEMLRYFLCFTLHQFSEGEGRQLTLFRRYPSRFPVRRIGFYVADGARLVTWDRREWVTDEQLDELRSMYLEERWIYAPRHQPHDRSQMKLKLPTTNRPRRRVAAAPQEEAARKRR